MDTIETRTIEREGQEYLVKFALDESPDLSWLGEYIDRPDWGDRFLIVDRKAQGDWERNQYQYFVCAYDLSLAQSWYTEHGYSRHDAYTLPRKHARDHYERMEAFNRGNWYMMGVIVELDKGECPQCGQGIVLEESLWGIESDGKAYIEDIITDLIAELG